MKVFCKTILQLLPTGGQLSQQVWGRYEGIEQQVSLVAFQLGDADCRRLLSLNYVPSPGLESRTKAALTVDCNVYPIVRNVLFGLWVCIEYWKFVEECGMIINGF